MRSITNWEIFETRNQLAGVETILVAPEYFTQNGGFTSIRFTALSFFGLNANHFVTAVVLEHAFQSVIESTNFEDCNERISRGQHCVA